VEHVYQGYGRSEGKCEISVNGNVVIASEYPYATWTSITNAAESLATSVSKQYGINPSDLIWIEHYVEHGTYDLVKFKRFGEKLLAPIWARISSEDANYILETGAVMTISPTYFVGRD
jgi:hypothetical protein